MRFDEEIDEEKILKQLLEEEEQKDYIRPELYKPEITKEETVTEEEETEVKEDKVGQLERELRDVDSYNSSQNLDDKVKEYRDKTAESNKVKQSQYDTGPTHKQPYIPQEEKISGGTEYWTNEQNKQEEKVKEHDPLALFKNPEEGIYHQNV